MSSIASLAKGSATVQSTLDRSKMIEAEQRALIKKRLVESPPLDDLDIPDDNQSANNNDSPDTSPLRFNRTNVPPPLKFLGAQRYIPVSIKTAPMRVNYRKSLMMKKLHLRALQNNNFLMVPRASQRQPMGRITKTTLLKPATIIKAPVKTPISLSTGKQVKTPIVADVFQQGDTQHNKVAPLVSQPASARQEYFTLSDGELEDLENPNNQEFDFDVESCAIEEDAVESRPEDFQKEIKAQLKLGDECYEFDMKPWRGNLLNARAEFLRNCVSIWNKHVTQ